MRTRFIVSALLVAAVACGKEKVCPTDQLLCDDRCTSVATDPANCGGCGVACGASEACLAGQCEPCAAGLCAPPALFLACFNSDDVRGTTGALEPVGIPLAVAPGPIGLASLDGRIFVASAAFGGVETLSAIRFDPAGAHVEQLLQTAIASPDIQYFAAHGGLLYVAHASVGTLLVVAPDGTIVDEIRFTPIGEPNPNPQGIAFLGNTAYLALNALGAVVVLDVSGLPACARGERSPPCTAELARVDVRPLASAGANAQPSRIAVVGGRAFVTLWNLDGAFNPPAGSTGRLAVIDTATDTLDGTVMDGGTAGRVDLGEGCLNPADVAVSGDALFVTCGAFQFDAQFNATIVGSGIVPVDLSGTAPLARPVRPMAADEAPGKLAFCGGAGYVGDRNSGRVFPFDAATGTIGPGVELCPPQFGFAFVSDIACGF